MPVIESPGATPLTSSVGVESAVCPDELVGTVGVEGGAGGVVSMARSIDGLTADLLPAKSVTVALTDQIPSVSV
jgi:hypothetical protein